MPNLSKVGSSRFWNIWVSSGAVSNIGVITDVNEIKEGLRVKTVMALGNTKGMFIKQEYLNARQPNKEGTVLGYVAGHGGDVWWVEHDDGMVGAYVFNELNKL
jgi:hypothetical protein